MTGRHKILLGLAAAGLACSACSYQAWYEGFRESERRQCYELTGWSEIRQCLDKVDAMSYEQYRQARDRKPQPPP